MCQAESAADGSWFRVPRPVDLALRAVEQLRRYGTLAAIRAVCIFLARLVVPQRRSAPRSVIIERLNLQPGEIVEVKSRDEIKATLDSRGTLHGLTFSPVMYQFCGKRFVVHRRMERMYLEESRVLRCIKNTVLLQGVMCDGLLMRCDKSCFFYWREAWLRRVDGFREEK